MTGLETVRNHHLAAAHARAESILRQARAQAQKAADQAAADSAALVSKATREGQAAAELDTSLEWSAARRQARTLILAAQGAIHDDLHVAVASAIRSDSRYTALLGRLADAARRQLGPGAEVEIDSRGDRGVTAARKGRHVDWSLHRIVAAAIDGLGPGIQELWR